jgi:hypothetical protein
MATAVTEYDTETRELWDDQQLALPVDSQAHDLELTYIAHEQIHPDPDQPRKDVDGELRDSIRANGILQPISVRFARERAGDCECCGRAWRDIAGAAEYELIAG